MYRIIYFTGYILVCSFVLITPKNAQNHKQEKPQGFIPGVLSVYKSRSGY